MQVQYEGACRRFAVTEVLPLPDTRDDSVTKLTDHFHTLRVNSVPPLSTVNWDTQVSIKDNRGTLAPQKVSTLPCRVIAILRFVSSLRLKFLIALQSPMHMSPLEDWTDKSRRSAI